MSSSTPGPRPPAAGPEARRLVFVVGSGRSGTSTMAGALRTLGMHVPRPEVPPDETNPKGFAEAQWVVDLHRDLLARCQVQVSDSRPSAWLATGRLATDDEVRDRVHRWLLASFTEEGDELVVKDPRLAWFVGLWRSASLRAGVTPSWITMLRPVTEVVGSKQRYYEAHHGETARTAAWVNMMLHTERATRGSRRAFVHYEDLLTDWTQPMSEIGERFDLAAVRGASANDIRRVHRFIDPSLRRVQLTWDDLRLPATLRAVAEESWQGLAALAEPDGDTPEAHRRLDAVRAAYAELYDESEALVTSSLIAARRAGSAPPSRPAPPEPRLADRVPHGVRSMVPGRVRRGLRSMARRER